MRKVLLASTALVALGSVSAMAADVTISGSYKCCISHIDNNGVATNGTEISSSSDLDIQILRTQLDNGMTMSMAVGLNEGGAKDDQNFHTGRYSNSIQSASRPWMMTALKVWTST